MTARNAVDGLQQRIASYAGTLVFGANVRWNFTTAGLTAPLTPSVGLEYDF